MLTLKYIEDVRGRAEPIRILLNELGLKEDEDFDDRNN